MTGKIWIKALSILLCVFAFGCLSGFALDEIYHLRSVNAAGNISRSDESPFESLRRNLNLNADQSTAIRAILEDTRNSYKSICAETQPKYAQVRDNARLRIRALLMPQQQQQFDSMVANGDCQCLDQGK
jgi:hypothetical protein